MIWQECRGLQRAHDHNGMETVNEGVWLHEDPEKALFGARAGAGWSCRRIEPVSPAEELAATQRT